MLNKYTPQPNTMDMGGMTMMGQPTVVGAGNDANNYLDMRKQRMTNDQGTVRVDHSFGNGDTAFFRYSGAGEYGFMPEGLPGFGFYHDDLSQQGMLAWNHVFSSHLVNMASVAISRLSMMHTTESANKNDIVDRAGNYRHGVWRSGRVGRTLLQCAGIFAAGRQLPCDADARLGHGGRRPRLAELADRPPQRQVWRRLSEVHLADVGLLPESRLLPVHQRLHHRVRAQRRHSGSSLASFLLGLPAARQGQAGVPQMDLRQWYADAFAQDAWRLTSTTTLTYGLRYEFMSPLVDIRYTNSNLDLSSGTPQVFIGGQNGYPRGLMYANHTNFAPRLGLAQSFPRLGLVGSRRLRHLLYAGGHEHLVQSAPQCSVRLSADVAKRSFHCPAFRT